MNPRSVTIPIRDGMTEGGVLILAVLTIVILFLAVAGLVVWRFGAIIAGRLKAVQEQVANDHKHPDGSPINLRDDLDTKHVENARKLDQVLAMVAPLQRDVSWLMRRLVEEADRIDDLEDTFSKGTHHGQTDDPRGSARAPGSRSDDPRRIRRP